MDNFLIISTGILIIGGLLGCLISKFPGAPVSYVGLVVLHYTSLTEFSVHFFIRYGLLVIAVQGLDYLIPNWGEHKFGGSRLGVWGSITGMLALMYFGPAGIMLGAIFGAFLGELFAGKESNKAIQHAINSFVYFILGTILQVIVCGIFLWYYIDNLRYIL
ncbi:MAG: DUF456 domain-containing protein [Paludibacter sp.]